MTKTPEEAHPTYSEVHAAIMVKLANIRDGMTKLSELTAGMEGKTNDEER